MKETYMKNQKKRIKELDEEKRELLLKRAIIKRVIEEDKSIVFNDYYYDKKISYEELLHLSKLYDMNFFMTWNIYFMCKDFSKFQDIYKESLVCYHNVLNNYKKLAQELNINSALELCHLLAYMLWNGYYSVTKEHFYSINGRLLLPGMFSFDVIKGKGVCSAYSCLLDDYLTTCGKESSPLICDIPKNKNEISCDYELNIERNVDIRFRDIFLSKIKHITIGQFTRKSGNHAITLIEDVNKIYAYDPTNLYALNIKDSHTATIVNGKGEYEIKPLLVYLINPISIYSKMYDKLIENDIENGLTREEFITSFRKIKNLVYENNSLLNDAYDNIHSNLEFIDEQTDIFGNNRKKALRKRKKINC